MTRAETVHLVDQIKTELEMMGYCDQTPAFRGEGESICKEEPLPLRMEDELLALRQNYYVNTEICDNSVGVKRKIKKLVGKITGLYIKPIINNQNLYNINLLQAIEKMCFLINEQDRELTYLRGIVSDTVEKKEVRRG